MNSAWLQHAIAWISAHPHAAGLVIFLIAFCDALVIVGIVVPALPLLFAVGALVGLGHINGPYALACAAAGAFTGDYLSYWVGRRWGLPLRQRWPFTRYPQLLRRGEQLLGKHGRMSIVIARFVGAVRPFVPAIAGTLQMPVKRYAPASVFAALSWAAIFLAPGWLLGASYDAVAAVADRLALVLGALLLSLGLVWALIVYSWRWFDGHANALLARLLRWTHAHPRLGRYAAVLVDPKRPESASLAVLAVCMLLISWALFALLAMMLARGGPLMLDHHIQTAMFALRNPLADHLMAGLATLGDAQVLAPAALLALLWLLWRRRWLAAAHWLAALAFGFVLTAGLDAVVNLPRPPTAPAGFGFPAISVTMTTITLGFFAVLIARELPGRNRVWPYLLAGVAVALLGFARLYLGAHWLSDILGGVLLGLIWVFLLGLAYRSHVARSFWMRPLALFFYGSLLLAALWHAPRQSSVLLARFQPPAAQITLSAMDWQATAWSLLPAHRNENDAARGWRLDLQVAGPLAPLQTRLQARGWRVQPQADWTAAMQLLDDDIAPQRLPVLPATLGGHAEALLMIYDDPAGNALLALRLWPAPAWLSDGTPLWIGSSQKLGFTRPLGVLGLWQPLDADNTHVHRRIREAVRDLDGLESPHPASGLPVLRIDTRSLPQQADSNVGRSSSS